MKSWVEFFPKFISRGGWNKNVLAGKFWKNSLAGAGGRLLGTKEYVYDFNNIARKGSSGAVPWTAPLLPLRAMLLTDISSMIIYTGIYDI